MNVTEVPIPTSIQGWNYGSYGIWALVLLQAVVLAGVVARNGPKWLESWAVGKRMGREDERLDATAKQDADVAVSMRIGALEERVSRMGQAVSFLMNAAITSTNALEASVPGNPAIGQSRELIGLAASALGDQDPFSKALNALASVKGVGE